MARETTYATPKELAHRVADGIDVTLFWHPTEDRLTVSVSDARLGDSFVIPAPRDRALDVFQHPFAYAAGCGIDYATRIELGETVDV